MSAATLLAEATVAGARPRLTPEGRLRAPAAAPPELLARLREHKAELVEILKGNVCRRCGEPMGWPAPAGVVEHGGTALHYACYVASEVERVERSAFSPDALADEAEMMLQGRMV